MTDRLTAVIEAAIAHNDGGADRSHTRFLARCVAAAIRDDQTVRTVDELEALPVGTVVRSHVGGLWERMTEAGRFCWDLRYAPGVDVSRGVDWLIHGFPFTVLYRPDQEVSGA